MATVLVALQVDRLKLADNPPDAIRQLKNIIQLNANKGLDTRFVLFGSGLYFDTLNCEMMQYLGQYFGRVHRHAAALDAFCCKLQC